MRLGLNWIRLALTAWTMTITKLTQTWVECYHLVSLIGPLGSKIRLGLVWAGLGWLRQPERWQITHYCPFTQD